MIGSGRREAERAHGTGSARAADASGASRYRNSIHRMWHDRPLCGMRCIVSFPSPRRVLQRRARGYVRWGRVARALHVRACAVHTGQSPRSNQSLHETLNTTVCAAPQPDHTQHTHGTHPGFPCFRNIDFPSEHTTDTFASKDTLHASLSTSLSSSFLSSSYLSSLTWERGPRSHVPRL